MNETSDSVDDIVDVDAKPAVGYKCGHCDAPQGNTDSNLIMQLSQGHAAIMRCPRCDGRIRVSLRIPQIMPMPGVPNRKQRRAAKTKGGIIVPGR